MTKGEEQGANGQTWGPDTAGRACNREERFTSVGLLSYLQGQFRPLPVFFKLWPHFTSSQARSEAFPPPFPQQKNDPNGYAPEYFCNCPKCSCKFAWHKHLVSLLSAGRTWPAIYCVSNHQVVSQGQKYGPSGMFGTTDGLVNGNMDMEHGRQKRVFDPSFLIIRQ